MKGRVFTIPELSEAITDIVMQNIGIASKKELLDKIASCLQQNINGKLVPSNYIVYQSKKEREAWIRTINEERFTVNFWKEIVREQNPDKIQIYYDQLNQLLVKNGFRKIPEAGTFITCFYCEREIDAAFFGGEREGFSTKDHVVPKSKGGKNNHKNLVNACNWCNWLKADMTINQFIKKLEYWYMMKIDNEGVTHDLYPTIIKNAKQLL